jgi:uncharacterized protein involved in exopolysaccharide biosynthesis
MMTQKQGEGQGTLRDIAYVIFKHKKNMIIIFCATVACAAIASLVMTPVYRANAKILVKFGRENVYSPAVGGASNSSPVLVDPQREEHINSAIEMIKGQKVVETVIQKVGLKNIYPKLVDDATPSGKESALSKATTKFQKKLRVQAVKKANIIDIKFDHSSPAIAVKVVSTLIDTFVEDHVTAYRQPRNFSFFSEQVNLLSRKLQASEAELEAFRIRHDISSLQEQKSTLLRQIADVEVDLAKTRADLSENRGKKEALEASQGSLTVEPRLGKETDANNPYALSAIRTRLTELRLKEAELLNRYPETSTLVVNVRNEIRQAEQLLAKDERTYHDKEVRSLDFTMQASKQKEATLKETLMTFQRRLNSLSAVEMRFKELERQFKLDEENYQLYVRKTEESRISNAMDTEKIVNLSIVEPAAVPVKPEQPKILLNIGLSILLGILLSLGVTMLTEYLRHTFNKAEDVEKRLGVPVLATIREMEA